MDELEKLIKEDLRDAKADECIAVLQNICQKLITDYYIVIENITIEPLWVEAYYYNIKHFPDCTTHRNDLQKNRFGQLYFHRKGRGGLDICLSTSQDYYLSFLLKATLINGKFNTQTGICSVLTDTGKSKEELECIKNVLRKRDTILMYDVKFTTRVGITKPCYADKKLAAFPMDILNDDHYNFTFAHKSLTPKAVETMDEYRKLTNCTKIECKKKCKEWFGWVPDAVDGIFKE